MVRLSILVAREFLKRENRKLPPNHRLYDLLAQAEGVEANEDRQCVRWLWFVVHRSNGRCIPLFSARGFREEWDLFLLPCL